MVPNLELNHCRGNRKLSREITYLLAVDTPRADALT